MTNANDLFPASAGQAGSANGADPAGTTAGQSGQGTTVTDTVPKSAYEDLEKKLGTQGQELGQYRTFFTSIEPLLEKLDVQPALVQAIINGKLDDKLAAAVMSGQVKLDQATAVTDAHQQVKTDLGDQKYAQATPEEINRLVEERLKGVTTDIDKRFEEEQQMQDFRDKTINFAQSTPDFEKYADKISEWLGDHPEQDDISVAYFAVKGMAYDEALKSGNQDLFAEAAKELALNASGGSSQGGTLPNSENLIDSLIARRSNPNNL